LKINEKSSDSTAAELPQELALELEEYPQHLGNDKDDLAVRNIEKERLTNPLPPFLKPLGMARGAKAAGLTGKRQQMFRPAPVRTS